MCARELFGESVAVANRFCDNCGQELSEDARFCSSCGRPIHETAHVPTPEADVPVPPPPGQQQAGDTVPPPQQEDTQELARAIVREAGIANDPEQEARIEATKLAAESAKTNVLLSTGALVGIGTLVGVLPSSDHTRWLVIAILLVSASVLVGFRRMEDLAERTASRRPPKWRNWDAMGPPILVAGLFSFAYYIVYNIEWQREGRLLDLTRDQFVYGTLITTLLITALIVGGRALYKRLRRRREDAAG